MINKIKIDLLMNREANSLKYTQYLSRINCMPQEFDYVEDIFLTDLIAYHETDMEFFK